MSPTGERYTFSEESYSRMGAARTGAEEEERKRRRRRRQRADDIVEIT
jgi:hypothetical protein